MNVKLDEENKDLKKKTKLAERKVLESEKNQKFAAKTTES